MLIKRRLDWFRFNPNSRYLWHDLMVIVGYGPSVNPDQAALTRGAYV